MSTIEVCQLIPASQLFWREMTTPRVLKIIANPFRFVVRAPCCPGLIHSNEKYLFVK